MTLAGSAVKSLISFLEWVSSVWRYESLCQWYTSTSTKGDVRVRWFEALSVLSVPPPPTPIRIKGGIIYSSETNPAIQIRCSISFVKHSTNLFKETTCLLHRIKLYLIINIILIYTTSQSNKKELRLPTLDCTLSCLSVWVTKVTLCFRRNVGSGWGARDRWSSAAGGSPVGAHGRPERVPLGVSACPRSSTEPGGGSGSLTTASGEQNGPEPPVSASSSYSETKSEPVKQKQQTLRTLRNEWRVSQLLFHHILVKDHLTCVSERFSFCAVFTLSPASKYLCLLKTFSSLRICFGVNFVRTRRGGASLSTPLLSSTEWHSEDAASLS